MAIAPLRVPITGDERGLRAALGRSRAELGSFSQKASRDLQAVEGRFAAMAGSARMAMGVLAGVGIASIGGSIIRTAAEFERLRGSLVTVTGSAVSAQRAFADIREFAARTPFDVAQVTTAFIRLKALGLDPSVEALTSYGNTSSAMGRNLLDFVEAVADAVTGENERLKEFGIRASVAGDQVTYTFQGVSTTVANNARDIEAYLRRIGNVQFAGAMDQQAQGLNGALSNLGDAAANVADAMGQGGLASAVAEAARAMSDAMTASENWATRLGGLFGETLTRDLADLQGIVRALQWIEDNAPDGAGSMADASWSVNPMRAIEALTAPPDLQGRIFTLEAQIQSIERRAPEAMTADLEARLQSLRRQLDDLTAGRPGIGSDWRFSSTGAPTGRAPTGIGSDSRYPVTLYPDAPLPSTAPHRDLTSDFGVDAARTADDLTRSIADLRTELQFEGEQLQRTAREQAAHNALRRAGVSENHALAASIMDSARALYDMQTASEAERTALSELHDKLDEMRDIGRDVFGGFFDDLKNGVKPIDAVTNALKRLADRLMDFALDGVLDALFGKQGTSGTGLIGGWLASLMGIDTGAGGQSGGAGGGIVGAAITRSLGASNDNTAGGYSGLAAPVTAVQRAALPAISSAAPGNTLQIAQRVNMAVDERLVDILQTAASQFGSQVEVISGMRPGDPRFHGRGQAMDVQILDQAGNAIPNYQSGPHFRQYEQFAQTARSVQMAKYPELNDQFRWGGYFSGRPGTYGAMDTMHFDTGGAGMGGGSWQGGLNRTQMGYYPGAESVGMGSANQALESLTTTADSASTSLSSFGSGIGNAAGQLPEFSKGIGSAATGLDGLGSGLSSFGSKLGAMDIGGGGGLLSGLGGSIIKLAPAIGGLYAKGGIANEASIFGEAGPEAAVPLPDGRRIPVDLRMDGPGWRGDLARIGRNSDLDAPNFRDIMGQIGKLSGPSWTRERTAVDISVSVDDDGKVKAYVQKEARSIATETTSAGLAGFEENLGRTWGARTDRAKRGRMMKTG
jgi:hypothetical protein